MSGPKPFSISYDKFLSGTEFFLHGIAHSPSLCSGLTFGLLWLHNASEFEVLNSCPVTNECSDLASWASLEMPRPDVKMFLFLKCFREQWQAMSVFGVHCQDICCKGLSWRMTRCFLSLESGHVDVEDYGLCTSFAPTFGVLRLLSVSPKYFGGILVSDCAQTGNEHVCHSQQRQLHSHVYAWVKPSFSQFWSVCTEQEDHSINISFSLFWAMLNLYSWFDLCGAYVRFISSHLPPPKTG